MIDVRKTIVKRTFVRHHPKSLTEDEASKAFDAWIQSLSHPGTGGMPPSSADASHDGASQE